MVPNVIAHGGGHGGHSGGHAPRMPHFSGGGQPAYRPSGTSHSTMSAGSNRMSTRMGANSNQTRTTHARSSNGKTRSGASTAATTGSAASATSTSLKSTLAASNGLSPNTYTYGTGNGARNYRAYGYGNGSRNRRYGRGSGYGRNQGNARAIVAQLRSVRSNLARIDHTYQGHRVRAMPRSPWQSASSRTGRVVTTSRGFHPVGTTVRGWACDWAAVVLTQVTAGDNP